MNNSTQPLTATDLLDFNAGNSDAFNRVTRFFYQQILYFAHKLLNSRQDAEDITQETFVQLWLNKGQFASVSTIRAFLYITTKNSCFNMIRYGKNQNRYKDELLKITKEEDENVLHAMIENETIAVIYDIIQKLPHKSGEVLRMLVFEGLNNQEIAEKMGITPKSVNRQKLRALIALQVKLMQRNIIPLFVLLLSYPFVVLINFLRKILH